MPEQKSLFERCVQAHLTCIRQNSRICPKTLSELLDEARAAGQLQVYKEAEVEAGRIHSLECITFYDRKYKEEHGDGSGMARIE